MPKPQTLLLCLISLFWAVFLLSGCGDKTPQSISADNLPKEIEWIHSWIGKGNISARTVFALKLTNDRKAYVVDGETSYSYRLDKTHQEGAVSAASVQKLLKTVRQVPWQRSDKMREQIIAGNEYTNQLITFKLPGNETFSLQSTSNTDDGHPWNLYVGERTHAYITEDMALGQAVSNLHQQLKSEN